MPFLQLQTKGWKRLPVGRGQVWRDRVGDTIIVQEQRSRPELPADLSDLALLRRLITEREVSSSGTVIDLDPVTVDSQPGFATVMKLPGNPDDVSQPGQIFVASVTVPKADAAVQTVLSAVESPPFGERERILRARLGAADWEMPHPFAPELAVPLPAHRGDDVVHDAQFGSHPLTRARAFVRHVVTTGRLDRGFAAREPYERT